VLTILAIAFPNETEIALYYKTVRIQNPGFTEFMRLVTDATRYILYVLFAWFFCQALLRREREGIVRVVFFVVVQIVVSAVLVQCFKVLVGSPRPMQALVDPASHPFSPDYRYHSFPSGHTTEITGAASTLASWRRGRLFSLCMGLLTAVVGYSRIYLSQHHIVDVVAGMVLGSLASLLVHYLCSREYRYDKLFRQVFQ
jgi:undecaprenyl-diphosphatase